MLAASQRQKLDESNDTLFYEHPRFVTHVDERFIEQLTELYQERLTPNSCILDMMSSWVSHLPSDMQFAQVEGHGMNAEELAKNPRLDHYFVQDLNDNQTLPFKDCTFDAVLNTVSVQYLQQPETVFAEIYRVLKPGGIAIVSFSNRMFYQKAISAWRDSSDARHIALVKSYFASVKGFSQPEVIANQGPPINPILQMMGMASSDPFYALIAERMEVLVK
ncbi:class I SAM-dependent methyltransferase [Leptolyngbyaceae cyanobacterium CCMR0082]|uniref:Class I SAM-dependent methyltransferase n=1 Tax=Adonisia turfae CCMR0082 TaxID=2304604 RepID=A0A6M0SGZ0_9CYAN|nr:class I SAM-dependent methyltransferase [Adonisia turfae]MDV3350658.1 class I SAM-dependent methyltransferase [Leptothoe sp. LEGE 181152]NEZ67777.1 class I SAM-dependent methyltransferase [Adonisia turfae CCMR0082]